MITQLIPQQLLMCNWCACNWILIPRALLLYNCLSDISYLLEARQADTRDTHALHKLIPRQLKPCNWCVCNCNMNSPTIKVVCVMIFAPMVRLENSLIFLRAVPEYCWISRLVSGMVQKNRPSVFPIALPTVLGDDLRLSPSTVGFSDWFQEWLGKEARRFSKSLFQPYSETFWWILFFLEKNKENHQESKDFFLGRTPKLNIPGKAKTLKRPKDFLAKEKNKEIQKSKEKKKIRVYT